MDNSTKPTKLTFFFLGLLGLGLSGGDFDGGYGGGSFVDNRFSGKDKGWDNDFRGRDGERGGHRGGYDGRGDRDDRDGGRGWRNDGWNKGSGQIFVPPVIDTSYRPVQTFIPAPPTPVITYVPTQPVYPSVTSYTFVPSADYFDGYFRDQQGNCYYYDSTYGFLPYYPDSDSNFSSSQTVSSFPYISYDSIEQYCREQRWVFNPFSPGHRDFGRRTRNKWNRNNGNGNFQDDNRGRIGRRSRNRRIRRNIRQGGFNDITLGSAH